MNKKAQVIKALANSPYLGRWIVALKDVVGLFSVGSVENIRNDIVNQDIELFLNGLYLLETYFTKNKSSKKVNEFGLEVISDTLNLLKSIPEDELQTINHQILNAVFDVAVSNEYIMKNIDFDFLVTLLLTSKKTYKYQLHRMLFKTKACSMLNPKTIINIVDVMIHESLFDYELEVLKCDAINLAISKSPSSFYDLSKESLLRTKKEFYHMSSCYLYPEKGYYDEYIESIYIDWLKKSSRYIANDVLINDISSFFKSNKMHLKRIGLAIVNINYNRFESFFFERIKSLFNDKDYYPDLIQLIANNIAVMSDETIEAIINNVENEVNTNDGRIKSLKNRIKMLISKRKAISYHNETKNERIDVDNYGRFGYIVEGGLEEDKNRLFEEYKNLDYEVVLERFNDEIERSRYFEVVAHDAFYKYLMQRGEDFILDHINDFNSGLAAHIINEFKESEKLSKLLLDVVKKDNNVPFSAVLFAANELFKKNKTKDAHDILINIDFKKLAFREGVFGDSFINDLINEEFELYIEMLAYSIQITGCSFDRLKEAILYAVNNFDTAKTKALIAYETGRLARINKEYWLSLVDYAFDNEIDGINVSYLMYSIGLDGGPEVVKLLSGRDNFKAFLSMQSGSMEITNAQSVLFVKLVHYYLTNEINIERIAPFMNAKNFDGIRQCYISLSGYIKNSDYVIDPKRIEALVNLVNESFTVDDLNEYQEIDQLSRQVAGFICKTDGVYESSWDFFFKCFMHFKRYFSDECLELLEKFKNEKRRTIVQIMDKYVNSYSMYNIYEETLVKALKLFKNDSQYQDKYREWIVYIYKKNQDFDLEGHNLLP